MLSSFLSLAYKFVHNKADAEDIVQDAIADAIHQNTDGVHKLQPFIKTIVVNKAKAHFTRQTNGKNVSADHYPETMATGSNVFSHIALAEIIAAVKQHRDNTDYLLFEMNSKGYTYEEIARHTEETPVNLRQRMFLLRKWLKQNFEK